MKRRFVILGVLILVIGGTYYLTSLPAKTLVLTGVVTTDDVIVGSQIQGRLQELLVKQGDAVQANQRIAVIQPEQWQADMAYAASTEMQIATQVAQAQADLRFQETQTTSRIEQAQANLEAAKAEVTRGEADLANARLVFEREEHLYNQKVETQRAYDEAKAQFEAQKARVESLRKQAAAADAAVAMAKSNIEQIAARKAALDAMVHQREAAGAQKDKAQVRLAYTDIRAPISGIVDMRAALQGEVVTPGQAIVTLINPDDLWVRVDVEETYIDRVKIGDKMEVKLPSGATRPGEVFYRAIDADYATQRDVSRTKRDIKTFEIRLRCDNSDRALAVGMTAYVTFDLDH